MRSFIWTFLSVLSTIIVIVIATPIFAVVIVPLGIFYFLVQVRVCKGEWVQVRVCKGEWGFIEGGNRDRGKGRWKMGMLDISRNLWMIEKTN